MSNENISYIQLRTDGAFDGPISLVETSKPQAPRATEGCPSNHQSPSLHPVAKDPATKSLRNCRSGWKFTNWWENRHVSPSGVNTHARSASENLATHPTQSLSQPQGTRDCEISGTAPDCELPERGRKRQKHTEEGSPETKDEPESYKIDVLYENQRGWFFFGIPLYSQSSLLNFDPSPWMTRDGKDSAVNITSAQLPNPCWQWAWKTWYVDMGYDVDEEGWQYSFSFSKKFSWHGTHPWFHCFVRRRRWLRTRVRSEGNKTGRISNMQEPHVFNSDYFTIHPKRSTSPASVLEKTATQRSSSVREKRPDQSELLVGDVKDISGLMQALKLAVIDRSKIDALKQFIETGENELLSSEQHIPAIMESLVFQTSRMQLLTYLDLSARRRLEEPSIAATTQQRVAHLRKAISAAIDQVGGLWTRRDCSNVVGSINDTTYGHGKRLSQSSTMTSYSSGATGVVVKAADVEVDRI